MNPRTGIAIFIAILFVWADNVLAAPSPAIIDPGYTGGGIGLSPPLVGVVTVGWEFTAEANIEVSALGVFDLGQDGLTMPHALGIWSSERQLVALAAMPAGEPGTVVGQYRYVSIDPIILPAGSAFIIGATMPALLVSPSPDPDFYPNSTIFDIDPEQIELSPYVALTGSNRYATSETANLPEALLFPQELASSYLLTNPLDGTVIGTVEYYLLAPNMLLAVAPEPASILFISLMCAAGILRRAKHGQRSGHYEYAPCPSRSRHFHCGHWGVIQ